MCCCFSSPMPFQNPLVTQRRHHRDVWSLSSLDAFPHNITSKVGEGGAEEGLGGEGAQEQALRGAGGNHLKALAGAETSRARCVRKTSSTMKVYSKRSLRSFQPKECHSVSERTLGSARGWFAESTCSSAFKTCTSWAGQRPIIPYVRPTMWYLLFSTCMSKRNSMSTPTS